MFYQTISIVILSLILGLSLLGCAGEPTVQSIPEPTITSNATVEFIPEPTATSNATESIILADISDDPVEKITIFQPLADYLAARLQPFGIGVGEVKVARDIETMSQWLASS